MLATGNSYDQRTPLARNYIVAKRVLDLLIAGTALVMFSPLLAFICLGIKLEGRSQAVLVRQRAVFNGEFAIYKFATTASPHGFRRVTRAGALLQGTSLDELPQLFNVLCGHMSMVGPRPRVVDPKWNCHNPMHHTTQHPIKPGMIGWAQINRFRSETAKVDRVNHSIDVERWYINNWSVWLDLRILLCAMVYPA